jgi:ABC-type polar amino acid transport system ATPase subunit
MNPKFMLFDEPTSSFDPKLFNEVLDTMVNMARAGMTKLVVTHQLGLAQCITGRFDFQEMSKQVYLMSR